MQAYSDPERETDPYALPDVEVFHVAAAEFAQAEHGTWQAEATYSLEASPFSNLTDCSLLEGWYWWSCFPGCLPDSDPIGPFETEQAALEDAQDS